MITPTPKYNSLQIRNEYITFTKTFLDPFTNELSDIRFQKIYVLYQFKHTQLSFPFKKLGEWQLVGDSVDLCSTDGRFSVEVIPFWFRSKLEAEAYITSISLN